LDREEVNVVEPIGYGEIVLEDVVGADEFQFALDTYEVINVLVHADGVEVVYDTGIGVEGLGEPMRARDGHYFGEGGIGGEIFDVVFFAIEGVQI
jgi:hypothetical protein